METEISKMNDTVNLVDRVRAALSGYPNRSETEKESEEKVGVTKKVDGRTKAFRSTIKRIEARKIKKTNKDKDKEGE